MSALLMLAVVIVWYLARRRRSRRPLARMYIKRNVWDAIERWANHTEGVVAIEAAIVFPVLVLAIGIGIDGGLLVVADYKLVYGTSQAAIGMASGTDPQPIFAANSPGSVSCMMASDGGSVSCTAATNYPAIFSGLLNVSSIPLAATATAAVQRVHQ